MDNFALEANSAAPVNDYSIPFNKPSLVGNEHAYMAQAIANGHISGDGQFTKNCHRMLESLLGVERALLTTSCTHALEMAAILLDIQPGDEVIVPSFTFVSTVNAFVLRGARPVFIDIRPDTLNLDESLLSGLFSTRTRAVVPVHYGGVACEMRTILELCKERSIPIVEDNAHGLFGSYNGKLLGTFGTFAAQSFHETKNFQCGEGGALLINDKSFVERAEIIREKGANRSQFLRGQIDKYSWVDVGSSYLPSDLLAAFLYAQLEKRAEIQERRKEIWTRYYAELSRWSASRGFRLPTVPAHCIQSYHLFYLLLDDIKTRLKLIAHLANKGILAIFHYVPLHSSKMGRSFGFVPGQFPTTEFVSDRLLRLPFYNSMCDAEQERVIEALLEF